MHSFCSVVLGKQMPKTVVGRYTSNDIQENIYSPTSALDDDKKEGNFKQADMHAIKMTGFENPVIDEVSQQ